MVDRTCLENRHAFTGIGGSNPPPSVSIVGRSFYLMGGGLPSRASGVLPTNIII